MVRVMPVHNFCEQNVSQIEEPAASCAVNSPSGREFLLLALASHCVEVHELTGPHLKLFTTFPTVDLAQTILHCSKGNYVACLETKSSRDNAHVNRFVRVYVNWEQHDHRYAMRARIAGRVTPSLNRPANGLEMIELPLNSQPTAIACCQKTGNLLVATGTSAILHEFKIETQQPSKQKFIDFEARPWSLGFHFAPTKLEIIEDFVSIMDPSHFVVFRLTNPFHEGIDCLGSMSSNNSSSNDKTTVSTDVFRTHDLEGHASLENGTRVNANCLHGSRADQHECQDCGNGSVKSGVDRNSNIYSCRSKFSRDECVDWDRLVRNETKESRRLLALELINEGSSPVTVSLPSINLERVGPGRALSPFELDSPDTEVFIKTTSPENGWSENYTVKGLLRLKIAMADLARGDGVFECFTCSVLKPLYLKVNANCGALKKSTLHSDEFKYLNGVTCLICTVQEGFVYHFSSEVSHSEPVCLTSYPFTAPVSHVSLEYTVLHALTEAGLESYTLRLPHYVARTLNQMHDVDFIHPDFSEPVCLIGLRPFLGIQRLLSSKHYVVLLARADESWTLYSLKLPEPEEVYFDILNAAKGHKNSSPSTYRHLLEEACSMIWLAKNVMTYRPHDCQRDNAQDTGKLDVLYHQACALLGDYYVMSDCKMHWRLCILYYKMSGLKPDEVLSRKAVYNAPGLLSYVTEVLLTINNGPEADALFQGQNVIDIIAMENKEDLLKLILNSTILREYATEKLIKLLSSKERDDFSRVTLAVLYIHADKQDYAEKIIEPVSKSVLWYVILDLPHLLFEESVINVKRSVLLSFSEFAGILMRRKTKIFTEILAALIENGHANLHQVIQAFMEYLPSRVGRDGHDDASALQLFIETYMQHYFRSMFDKDFAVMKKEISHNYIIIEAFKILIRSYLGKLLQIGIHRTGIDVEYKENYLFAQCRPPYLDKMPPCAKDFQQVLNSGDLSEINEIKNVKRDGAVRFEVLKLQALLASNILPQECLDEIERFLETESVTGSLAFKTLINNDCQAVTLLLMEKCPQAVLSYAKTKFTDAYQWEFLVELLKNELLKPDIKPEMQYFFEQTLSETLKHVAVTIPFKYLNNVFPKDDNGFPSQHYMDICGQVVRAEHVKSLIKEMSQQLLTETIRPRSHATQNLEVCQKNGDICCDINNFL